MAWVKKWGKLDHRGQLIRSYNHDALGVNAEISYKNNPLCLGVPMAGVLLSLHRRPGDPRRRLRPLVPAQLWHFG